MQLSVFVVVMATVSNAQAFSLWPFGHKSKQAPQVDQTGDGYLVPNSNPVPKKVTLEWTSNPNEPLIVSAQSQPITCAALAQQIADKTLSANNKFFSGSKFAEVYQVSKVEGQCKTTINPTADGIVRNDSVIDLTAYGKYGNYGLRLNRFSLGLDYTSGADQDSGSSSGAYKTYDACVEDTDRQQKLFESATGLVAVASTCQNSGMSLVCPQTPPNPSLASVKSEAPCEYWQKVPMPRYSMSIITVGRNPNIKLHSYVTNYNYLSDEAAQDLANRKNDIAALGGTVIESSRKVLYYYSHWAVTAPTLVAMFDSITDCLNQGPLIVNAAVQLAENNAKSKNPTISASELAAITSATRFTCDAFENKYDKTSYALNVSATNNVYISNPYTSETSLSYPFETYEDCQAYKAVTPPEYASGFGATVKICGPEAAGQVGKYYLQAVTISDWSKN